MPPQLTAARAPRMIGNDLPCSPLSRVSLVPCPLSRVPVLCPVSLVLCPVSRVRPLSPVPCPLSRVPRPVSLVPCPVSCVLRPVSLVPCPPSLALLLCVGSARPLFCAQALAAPWHALACHRLASASRLGCGLGFATLIGRLLPVWAGHLGPTMELILVSCNVTSWKNKPSGTRA